MKKNALKFLADPSKLASKFDWSREAGSILALDVGRDKIGLAVASHPECGESPLQLDPMPLKLETRGNKKVLAGSVLTELQEIVQSYNVCGFLVSWPLQKDGRCGAPCGKVMHTLDSLVAESSSIVNITRPFCLWDEHHYVPGEDEWGRLPKYGDKQGRHTTKTLHIASEEQYFMHECSSSIAVDVWNDYCAKHWPDLYNREEDSDEDDIWDVKTTRIG